MTKENYDIYEDYFSETRDKYKISSVDLLTCYINDISKYPLLKPAQEKELALKIVAGDKDAREKLIEHNLRLVVLIARLYSKWNYYKLLDLIQIGNVALVRAVDTYDPTKGKFSTYASRLINNNIFSANNREKSQITIPTCSADSIGKIMRVIKEFNAEFHRQPTIEEISKKTGYSCKKVKSLVSGMYEICSLDEPIDFETIGNIEEEVEFYFEVIPDENNIEELYERRSLIQLINENIVKLSEEEIYALKLRFGFDNNKPMTYKQIAECFGFKSSEGARLIVLSALEKLREKLGINTRSNLKNC